MVQGLLPLRARVARGLVVLARVVSAPDRAAVLRRRETRQVLVEKEEFREFRIARLHPGEPWGDDGEEQQQAAGHVHPVPQAQVALRRGRRLCAVSITRR